MQFTLREFQGHRKLSKQHLYLDRTRQPVSVWEILIATCVRQQFNGPIESIGQPLLSAFIRCRDSMYVCVCMYL